MRRLLVLIMGMALLPLAAACSPAGQRGAACDIPAGENGFADGRQVRSFRIALPPGGANASTPMVVSLHAMTGDAALQEEVSGFSALGAAEGFIAVYPQGEGLGEEKYWDAAPGSADVQDVAALIASLHDEGCSSPQSTYVNGWSMGAMMTSRLLCERPEIMAGAGMVAGVLPPEPGCRIPGGIAVSIVHSRDDPTVPFDGRLPSDISGRAGGEQSANFPGITREAMGRQWALAKGCPDPVPQTVREPGQTVTTWTGCGNAPTVVHIRDGGRHDWNPIGPAMPPTSLTLWRDMRLIPG